MNHTVSVIIPTYNCGHFNTEAVDSVLAQTIAPTQIIVIDDGSTDDTATRLQPYLARGVTYLQQKNAGVSAARNHGLRLATSDFIAFLDADDVWHPQKLELQLATLAPRLDLGILGTGRFDWPNVRPKSIPSGDSPVVEEILWRDLVMRNYFTTSSIVARRSAISAAGETAFDTALQGPEDYDLWLRISEQTQVANLQLALTGYRDHTSGLGSHPQRMEEGTQRILEKLKQRGAWKKPGGRRLRRRAFAYHHYVCAYMHSVSGSHAAAVIRALRSLLDYPWPFSSAEVRIQMARPKLLGMATLRMLRLRAV